jgi:hypothetical protein
MNKGQIIKILDLKKKNIDLIKDLTMNFKNFKLIELIDIDFTFGLFLSPQK